MRYLVFTGSENERLEEDGKLVASGEEFGVSDARAEQLLADPNVAVYPAPDDDLQRLTREKLDDLASQAGLDPTQYPNKDAVIAALTNPPVADGVGQDDTPQEA
jgi:hypothetical protein